MSDLDRGQGDESKFSADDLERLYREGFLDVEQIQGSSLNKILDTKKYVATAWYRVTRERIERI